VPFDCGGAVVGAPPNENDIGTAVLNADVGATVVPEHNMTMGDKQTQRMLGIYSMSSNTHDRLATIYSSLQTLSNSQ
jgi:hypothetical protein